MKTISKADAIALKMHSLTSPYSKSERKLGMMDRVIEDMERGNINYAVVRRPSGFEIWRTGIDSLINGKAAVAEKKQKG